MAELGGKAKAVQNQNKIFLRRKTKGLTFESDARLPLVGGGAAIVN